MNSEEIIKVLEYLGNKFGVAIDWTQENVLPYAQELFHRIITYKIVENSACCILALINLVVVAFIIRACIKSYKESGKENKDTLFWEDTICGTEIKIGALLFLVFYGVFSVVLTIIGVVSFFELLEWIFVPEIPFWNMVKDVF